MTTSLVPGQMPLFDFCEPTAEVPAPLRKDMSDPLRVNFSGYGLPATGLDTIEQVSAYYLAPGYSGEGFMVSGDETARFNYWHRTRRYPSFADLPY